MSWFFRVLLAGIVSLAALETASAEPRRVLLLHSFGPQFAPWTYFSGQFREALIKQSPNAIDLYEASLESARFAKLDEQGPLIEYLRSLFAQRKLDLIVTMGAPAARFVQRYRPQFFPSTPLIMGAVEQRVISGAALTANDTAVSVALALPKFIEHILRVLPDTTHIAWAIGASPLERFWVEELHRASQPFTNRVTFEWFDELSFEDILRRIEKLPPHSAVFFGDIRVDAAGVPLDHERALARLREATNAPIFSYVDSYLGQGIVGGPLLSTEELGRRMAAVAVRILSGEAPENIKTPPLGLGAPVYDWRELTHWKISEARLPPGSIVRFGELTVWERYRWPLMAGSTLVSLQGAMSTWLLLERRSRRKAEGETRRRSLEVMHLSRTAEAGALSASFAHELSQPLTAIMLSAEEAGRLLGTEPPNVSRAKEIIGHIWQADQHATEIISHVKKLLKRRSEVEAQEFDLNEAIADAIQILSPEAKKRKVTLLAMGIQEPLPVRADSVHLQQVILNLARNGMDAMTKAAPGAHTITIQTALLGESTLEVSVSDSGTGIPEHKLGEIFDTFYTTKEHGTGLGLSIARTIVETYGGKIWAENRPVGGAVIRFTLPLICRSA
jgi:signal transduction histidine kinase